MMSNIPNFYTVPTNKRRISGNVDWSIDQINIQSRLNSSGEMISDGKNNKRFVS